MVDAASELLRVLDLDDAGDGQFRGVPPVWEEGRIFGGQLLSQALVAAQRSIDPERDGGPPRAVHSLHASFLRPGAPEAIDYRVDRIRDGRSFSTRTVTASQNDRDIFTSTMSFQVPETGADHQVVPPPASAEPESAIDYVEWISGVDTEYSRDWQREPQPIEIRYVDPPAAEPGSATSADQRMYLRTTGPVPDDPRVHEAVLAWMADKTLVDNVLLPIGERWADDRLQGASLDHAMWFHRPCRTDQWVQFDQRTRSVSNARGLATADVFGADGTLAATVAQEGLIRFLD